MPSPDDPKVRVANRRGEEEEVFLSVHLSESLRTFEGPDGYEEVERTYAHDGTEEMVAERRDDMLTRLIGVLAAKGLLDAADLQEVVGHPLRTVVGVEGQDFGDGIDEAPRGPGM